MKTTKHKFGIGDTINLVHDKSVFGIVTAIWIRKDGVSYEIGYSNGEPKHATVQECEIEMYTKADFGFVKKDSARKEQSSDD